MWSHIIQGIHNLKYKSADCIAKKLICGVWKNIDSIKEELKRIGKPLENMMKKQVNDSKNTLFCERTGVVKELSNPHSLHYTHWKRRNEVWSWIELEVTS